ncbi:MAG: hypothetical protein JWN78_2891 [Bacteroidota bacterium]|nr:hypothetical protein [Bacteroidota bacterium]
MEGQHTNWLALIVATLATQVLGFIWYHPKVFGRTWMENTVGTEEKARQGNMLLNVAVGTLLMFAIAYELKYVAHGGAEFTTFKHGAYHAGLDGLFILIPVIGTISLYEHKGIKYFLMTTGYWLLSFVLIGGIISWWR